ncbi:gamma-tubulin complex component 5-like [Limulus polyphemus]|uniref:Gamma-tubulin complex component n=1 Tax=Limulus polyphemus TaxID=6850 RepID=A0ABM1TEE1_LIMPO|nr:gamma-tubulin complex component 5-like [Limulus polyphemus]
MAPLFSKKDNFKKSRDAKIENFSRKLIKRITGLKDDDQNFQLCIEFVDSNFKYHRFLDVNSHQVQKTIDGLSEKFLIHGQYQKARSFKSLTTQLLDSVRISHFSQKDDVFSILSLLLHLSESPVNYNYTPRLVFKDKRVVDVSEDVDWGTYLLEGEELSSKFSDSQEEYLSDDEDLEVEKEEPLDIKLPKYPPRRDDSGIDICSYGKGKSSSPETPEIDSTFSLHCTSGYSWLTQNIQPSYWSKASVQHSEPLSNSWVSNFVKEWEQYLEQTSEFYVKGQNIVLTERQVIRELLWMLSGIQDLFLFVWKDNRFCVQEDVQLSHLTQGCLSAFLQKFCDYGTTVVKLSLFVREISSSSSTNHCPSYQAYAAALSHLLGTFSCVLRRYEKILIKQEETLTLSMVLHGLQKSLQDIATLGNLHSKAVESISTDSPAWHRAVCLLSAIYAQLDQHDALPKDENESKNIILLLFLHTCQPYMNYLEGIISKNHSFTDPDEEFIICRSSMVSTDDEAFWEKALSVRDIPNSLKKSLFLSPFLADVVTASKSMELLQRTGYKCEIFKSKGSLYSRFLTNLIKCLEYANCQVQRTSNNQVANIETSSEELKSRYKAEETNKNVDEIDSLTSRFNYWLTWTGVENPFLWTNFQCLLKPCPTNLESETKQNEWCHKISVHSSVTLPLTHLIQDALRPLVEEECTKTCQCLIEVLKREYHLSYHLESIKNFFLMAAGDVMFSFCSEIFDRMSEEENILDPFFLNAALEDALSWRELRESHRLNVTINPDYVPQKGSSLNILENIVLQYQVTWPVNVLLSSNSLQIYNQVFTFLLQIKCAKYLLDELRFSDLNEKEPEIDSDEELTILTANTKPNIPHLQKIHGMIQLRIQILHFINSLHAYIMTEVLQPASGELDSFLKSAVNFDQVISTHNQYLCRLQEHCLLSPHLSILKKCVSRVLDLAPSFQHCWLEGAANINVSTLQHIEEEFRHCQQFLVSYLARPTRKGTFPHMESLAFAIQTLETMTKLFPKT